MRISTKLKIYLLVIHLVFVAILWILGSSVWLILGGELVLLVSFFIGFRWIQKIGRHFDMISMSMENIKSQDFTIRIKNTGQKEFDLLVKVYNHMIDKLRSERISTSEINYLLGSIIKASPSGIVLFDFDNRIKAINPAASEILNTQEVDLIGKRSDQLEKHVSDILFLEDNKWHVIHQGSLNIIRSYSGKFINQGFETRFVIFEDFSEEIHNVEKKAYEKLIRMMGHEVNNTAGAVNSVLDTYISKHDDAYARTFQIVKERNENLSQFMKRLSALARMPSPEKTSFDLMPVIKQAVVLIKAKFADKAISWSIREDSEPFMVDADQLQIEQVIINVLTNAAEAIDTEGNISIECSRPNRQLLIHNDGRPLSAEEEQQIFTLFYSTKPEGQGIGLTVTREILQQHGFRFHLKSLHDGLTEFSIQC